MAEKKEIITLLDEIADLLEFRSENPFKISAFRNGANTIRKISEDINELVNSGKLKEVKGIGKGIYTVVEEYCSHGFSTALEELKIDIPDSLFEIFQIRGLGPKKIAQLFNQENIRSVEELKTACTDNRLSSVKGFGEKIQKKILDEIKQLEVNRNFLLIHFAEREAEKIKDLLSGISVIKKYEFTGEVRRTREVFSSLEVVVLIEAYKTEELISALKDKIIIDEIDEGTIKSNSTFNLPLTMYIVHSENHFINRLFETTGSKEFLRHLNYSHEKHDGNSEEEIFDKMNSIKVAPEMREEEFFSITKAELKKSSNLTGEQLKGFFHFHTTYSDGMNSIEEMVSAAKNLGYDYFAVCDHSKTAAYANGLSAQRILQQKNEIEEITSKHNWKLLQGIESDILTNGDLDYPTEILQAFQFVVASVHSNFSLSEDDMTKRIIRAIENPFTDVLGHPTGRLLLHRAPYKHTIKKIIDACSRNKVAIEINAHPNRLDLDWRNIFYAREQGCLFSINADAHSIENILLARYGITVARKGGIQPEEVINCFSYKDFIKFLNRKVTRKVEDK
ncbi:MAG: DNA polymerase/3'-5' exonuclease PolX [Ignavibacteriaceae bacterium]|nr:DNA polymerase/3'-5' exonuclease PolX [Ignavibacteriaceae bacterium]